MRMHVHMHVQAELNGALMLRTACTYSAKTQRLTFGIGQMLSRILSVRASMIIPAQQRISRAHQVSPNALPG